MNDKYFKTAAVILSSIIIMTSCKQKYYYVEGNKEERVIKASSDSAAYMEAVKYFEISKKVYESMKETFGNTSLDRPISFKLLNSKREDITYAVQFASKDSLEEESAKRIQQLPNVIKESVQRNREQRHGIGAKYDTGGLYLSPVKILRARFVTREYSNYKDVSLSYKNVSKKRISAIRFKWYGENAFNEPADMGILSDGWGSGFTDELLRPGTTGYGTWSVLSKDGKKLLIAYPYEVAFEDGTKWTLGEY